MENQEIKELKEVVRQLVLSINSLTITFNAFLLKQSGLTFQWPQTPQPFVPPTTAPWDSRPMWQSQMNVG